MNVLDRIEAANKHFPQNDGPCYTTIGDLKQALFGLSNELQIETITPDYITFVGDDTRYSIGKLASNYHDYISGNDIFFYPHLYRL